MLSDYSDLLSILNAHGVKYLIAGAYAVAIYAQPRATKDLDILVKPEAENAEALFAALSEFGAPLQNVKPADFQQAGVFFRIGREPVSIDILTEIPGIDFDSAWQQRVQEIFDEQRNLPANFLSRNDLLASKRAAGRYQDLADVDAIERAGNEGEKPE